MFSKLAGGLAERIDPSISVQAAGDSVEGTGRKEQKSFEQTISEPKLFFEKRKGLSVPMPEFPTKDALSETINFLKMHKLYYPFVLAASTIILFFLYRPAFLVVSFIALGIASRIHQRFLRGISIGFETIIFGMAITGMLYGPWPAVLIGLIALPISVVYTEEDFKWMPVALGGMILTGFLAGTLPAMSILMLGMVLTLVYDVTTCAVYLFVFRSRIFTTLLFAVSHLTFNYFIFSRFGETVLSMLA